MRFAFGQDVVTREQPRVATDDATRKQPCVATERSNMETRVAILSIIVENAESVETINSLLHEYSECIIGRMGIPHRERGVSVICVALDAPQDRISALSGKVGRLNGVTCKATYQNIG